MYNKSEFSVATSVFSRQAQNLPYSHVGKAALSDRHIKSFVHKNNTQNYKFHKLCFSLKTLNIKLSAEGLRAITHQKKKKNPVAVPPGYLLIFTKVSVNFSQLIATRHRRWMNWW